MPLLYYGTFGNDPRHALYSPGLKPVKTAVFDSFKIDNLAPYSGKRYIANFWWMMCRKHSAISWHEECGDEHTVFIPGLLVWRDALFLAREHFKDVVPSAIVFRFNNYDEVYLYD